MADAVTVRTLYNGPKYLAVALTSISDGTGEAAVKKIDRSELTSLDGAAVGGLTLLNASWRIAGFDGVALLWDHTADVPAALLPPGDGKVCYRSVGGLRDSNPTEATGDIVLTTTGAAVGATYDILLMFRKEPV